MLYSKQILDHFKNPRNQGKLDDADGTGEVGNPKCGDVMRIYIKVGEQDGKKTIDDIKFETYGCGAAIATSSKMTELAKGQGVDEALAITKDKILEELGGKNIIPKEKYHCSILAVDAFAKAVENYRKRLQN